MPAANFKSCYKHNWCGLVFEAQPLGSHLEDWVTLITRGFMRFLRCVLACLQGYWQAVGPSHVWAHQAVQRALNAGGNPFLNPALPAHQRLQAQCQRK